MHEKKVLDLTKTVYELATEHPEFIEVMAANGFPEIALPGMPATAGRFMTVPKGAKLKGIDLAALRQAFAEKGFEVIE
jgi:hypothetical protein